MPCSCDIPELSSREIELNLVKSHLAYLQKEGLLETSPEFTVNDFESTLDYATACLCYALKKLSPSIIYDGRHREMRKIADWWDNHLEADKLREESEKEYLRQLEVAENILDDLNPDQVECLKKYFNGEL